MASQLPSGGWASKLLGGAVLLLLAAIALHAAVELVVSVWVPLAVIGGVGTTGCAAVTVWRRRRGGW